MKEFHNIKTERLLLRQFVDDDIVSVFKGLSHPDIIKYYGVSYQTLEDTKAQMKFFADLEKNETGIWWAVCSSDNKIFYGAGGLNNLSKEHKKAEIGFWLICDFWGQGIMTEALPLICNYGFDKLGIHRIEGIVETENSNCKKVMAKLDFEYEGTMRDCEIKNGNFISLEIYSKLTTANPPDLIPPLKKEPTEKLPSSEKSSTSENEFDPAIKTVNAVRAEKHKTMV